MDFAEKLYQWFHAGKKERNNRRFRQNHLLSLDTSTARERLEFFCQAINEGSVRIHLTSALEAPDRNALYLPRELGLGLEEDDNFSVYLFRLMAFHGALRHGFLVGDPVAQGAAELMRYSLAAPGIHRHLVGEYAGFAELLNKVRAIAENASSVFSSLDTRFVPWGILLQRSLGLDDFVLSDQDQSSLMKTWRQEWIGSPHCPLHILSLLPRLIAAKNSSRPEAGAPHSPGHRGSLPTAPAPTKQELRIKTVARPELKNMDQQEENPLTHVFEKLMTADEHKGGSKTQDGSDESDDHADALSELTLDRVTRTQTSTDSILKSDAQVESNAPDLEGDGNEAHETLYSYPEWFHENRMYKRGFCSLYESTLVDTGAPTATEAHPEHLLLSEKLSSFLNESRWKPRQKDGAEFDLDATVRWRSQIHGEGPVDQRIYMGRRLLERNLAILILMDSSFSTDAWSANRRVIDVMKSSISIISEAFAGFDDRFAIATFNSNSRLRCNYRWVKRFENPWQQCRRRLQSVKPDGYTRIGPALRHSHQILKGVKARRKLILLFSDAKPTDYDRYEGEHGLSDVRKAISEIKSQGLFVKGISVTQENRGNLARMFGSGNYKVISEPLHIANAVFEIFTEMMSRD